MGKTGEIKKPAASAPAADHAPKGNSAPLTSSSSSKSNNASAKLGCHATNCKEKDKRFNFCDEHFRQFKFGLISKTGEKVLDWERKIEHYQHWLKSQKVA